MGESHCVLRKTHRGLSVTWSSPVCRVPRARRGFGSCVVVVFVDSVPYPVASGRTSGAWNRDRTTCLLRRTTVLRDKYLLSNHHHSLDGGSCPRDDFDSWQSVGLEARLFLPRRNGMHCAQPAKANSSCLKLVASLHRSPRTHPSHGRNAGWTVICWISLAVVVQQCMLQVKLKAA